MGKESFGRRPVIIAAVILLIIVGIAFFAARSRGIVGEWKFADIEFSEEAARMIENSATGAEREMVEDMLDGGKLSEEGKAWMAEEMGVDLFSTTMKFDKDGSFYASMEGMDTAGSWSYDHSVLTLTINGDSQSMTVIQRGNKMKLAYTEDGMTMYLILKRV